MKRQSRILLFMALFAAVSLTAVKNQPTTAAVPEEPAVVTKAVAPSEYPAIARQARAESKVVVKVEIDAHGDVVSAHAIDGHPLLQSATVKAARRWQFAAVGTAEKRSAQLIFHFHIPQKKEEEETSFKPPYEIYFAPGPPQIN